MERTYVFNQDGNNGNGGGSKFDIMAMLSFTWTIAAFSGLSNGTFRTL